MDLSERIPHLAQILTVQFKSSYTLPNPCLMYLTGRKWLKFS